MIACGLLVLILLTGSACNQSKDSDSKPEQNGSLSTRSEEAAAEDKERNITFFAMDTYMTLSFWGGDDTLAADAEALVTDMESSLSTTDENSEISYLNRTGSAELSDEAAYLLSRAAALCAGTNGALDISIYPVVHAWGFANPEGTYRVPDEAELQELLEHVDYSRIELNGNHVTLEEGMQIDLGAVTKGRLGDRLCELLRQGGVKSALLDLGGNIQMIGTKPDGTLWRVGIKDPAGDSYMGVISVADCAVVTSGAYERYFIDDDGILRWHIIDPSDGYPAANGLVSVTIIGEEGLYCDALSTGLFIMGPENAVSFWQARRDFEMVLVTEDNEVWLTPSLAENFKPKEDCEYSFKVISDQQN